MFTQFRLGEIGITDAGILMLASQNYLVLTDDLPLFNYLQSQSVDVINFNHLHFF